jgi:hypothetical protein
MTSLVQTTLLQEQVSVSVLNQLGTLVRRQRLLLLL